MKSNGSIARSFSLFPIPGSNQRPSSFPLTDKQGQAYPSILRRTDYLKSRESTGHYRHLALNSNLYSCIHNE